MSSSMKTLLDTLEKKKQLEKDPLFRNFDISDYIVHPHQRMEAFTYVPIELSAFDPAKHVLIIKAHAKAYNLLLASHQPFVILQNKTKLISDTAYPYHYELLYFHNDNPAANTVLTFRIHPNGYQLGYPRFNELDIIQKDTSGNILFDYLEQDIYPNLEQLIKAHNDKHLCEKYEKYLKTLEAELAKLKLAFMAQTETHASKASTSSTTEAPIDFYDTPVEESASYASSPPHLKLTFDGVDSSVYEHTLTRHALEQSELEKVLALSIETAKADNKKRKRFVDFESDFDDEKTRGEETKLEKDRKLEKEIFKPAIVTSKCGSKSRDIPKVEETPIEKACKEAREKAKAEGWNVTEHGHFLYMDSAANPGLSLLPPYPPHPITEPKPSVPAPAAPPGGAATAGASSDSSSSSSYADASSSLSSSSSSANASSSLSSSSSSGSSSSSNSPLEPLAFSGPPSPVQSWTTPVAQEFQLLSGIVITQLTSLPAPMAEISATTTTTATSPTKLSM